jgi:hypothetical protein
MNGFQKQLLNRAFNDLRMEKTIKKNQLAGAKQKR